MIARIFQLCSEILLSEPWREIDGGMGSAYPVGFMGYYKREFSDSDVAIESRSMQAILLSSEEVAKRAYQMYEGGIRQKVETEENIGKMVIINIETGDYEVDETGLQAARNLQAKSPYARLFGIRIGYNVAASFGGVMERVSSDFRYGD